MLLMLMLLFLTFPVTIITEEHGQHRGSSFSGEYGSGGGTSFTLSGEHRRGRITGFRIQEQCNGIIYGIQFKYGNDWSQLHGPQSGQKHEVLLNRGENITQVLGKYYSTYIQQLIFVTNHGRIFTFGQPAGYSFNAHPLFWGGFLSYISGHHNSYGLTGIGFHWDEPRHILSGKQDTL